MRTNLLLSFLIIFALSACQSNDSVQNSETRNDAMSEEATNSSSTPARTTSESRGNGAQQRSTSTSRSAPSVDPSKKIPKFFGALDEDGYGLTNILDGSSPQAFADSLELISSDTSSSQYEALDSAIRYRRSFIFTTGSLEEFYRSMDGLTAEEIIQLASRRS